MDKLSLHPQVLPAVISIDWSTWACENRDDRLHWVNNTLIILPDAFIFTLQEERCGPLFSFSPRRIFQCTYNSRNECPIAYLKKFLSRPSEIEVVLHSPILYECIELSASVLRGNCGENQQQQQGTNTTPSPPSSLVTIMYYLIITFCNPSSFMSHCMSTNNTTWTSPLRGYFCAFCVFTNKVCCFPSHICYYLSLSTCYESTVIYQVPVMDVVCLDIVGFLKVMFITSLGSLL